MCRVVVSGVLHPKNINFFPSFVNNLNLQTFKNFDLLIINEGIDKSLLNINFKKGELIIENSKFANPKKNRDQMFDSLRELRYDVNILCDFDDLMSNDRVSEAFISIIKNKSEQDILDLLDELIKDHKDQANLKKIESLEQKLINNLDENSYSEFIKLKSQLNRD